MKENDEKIYTEKVCDMLIEFYDINKVPLGVGIGSMIIVLNRLLTSHKFTDGERKEIFMKVMEMTDVK